MADIEGIRSFLEADETGWNKGFESATKTVDKFADDIGKKLEKTGQTLSKAGRTLTAAITLPVGAAFAFATKAAIDAAETTSKFDFIFREVAASANTAAADLRKNYGLALTTSQELLASTGDILIGFGLENKEALATSLSVQKLASDIASLKNVQGGAVMASSAITRALLGEREMLKSLGIALLESEVKERARLIAVREGIGADSRRARTMASMELITERAANAVGDLHRTWTSAANQSRIFGERIKELSEDFGKRLIPVYAELLIKGNELIDRWNALTNSTKQQIIHYAALAASIGPPLLALGALVSGLGAMVMLASPVIGFFATVVTGALGLVATLAAAAAAVGLLWSVFGAVVDLKSIMQGTWSFIKNIWTDTVNFWADVVDAILGNTDTLTQETQTGVEIIAKAWLGLKIAWNAVEVGLQTVIQSILGGLDLLLGGFAEIAEFVGLDSLSEGARGAAESLQNLVLDIEDVKTSNIKTMKELIDSWGDAPDILKRDVKRFAAVVDTIGEEILAGVKEFTPGVVFEFKAFLDQIHSLLRGEAKTYPAELWGPLEESFAPGSEAGIAAFEKMMSGINLEQFGPLQLFGPGDLAGIDEFFSLLHDKQNKAAFEAAIIFNRNTEISLDKNRSIWDSWIMGNVESLKTWKDDVVAIMDSFVTSISTGLADVALKGKSFTKVMVSIAENMGSQLLSKAIETTIDLLAWNYAKMMGNSVGAAPSPWLIPAYVAAGIGFWGAAMSGTVAGGGGGGGGGTASVPEPIAQTAQFSRIETGPPTVDDDFGESGGSGGRTMERLIITTDAGEQLLDVLVRETINGKGTSSDRFATTRDIDV